MMITLNLSSSLTPKLKRDLVSLQNPNKLSSLNPSIPTSIHFNRSKHFSLTVKAQKFSSFDSSPSQPPGQSTPRVYVPYTIYKGKAALQVEPRPPEFSPLGSGAFKLSKEGFIVLQFAPAAGVRQYDWLRKQVFTLSVTEIGNIMSLGAKDNCEFFHDPHKGRSDEGKVSKVLKVEPLPDSSGYFFNLSVQNKLLNFDESIYIPVSKVEFAVLVSSFNYVVPYLLGWNTFVNAINPEDSNRANNSSTRTVDYEWSR